MFKAFKKILFPTILFRTKPTHYIVEKITIKSTKKSALALSQASFQAQVDSNEYKQHKPISQQKDSGINIDNDSSSLFAYKSSDSIEPSDYANKVIRKYIEESDLNLQVLVYFNSLPLDTQFFIAMRQQKLNNMTQQQQQCMSPKQNITKYSHSHFNTCATDAISTFKATAVEEPRCAENEVLALNRLETLDCKFDNVLNHIDFYGQSVGEGANGKVMVGHYKNSKLTVACKKLKFELKNLQEVKQAIDEASVMKLGRHPNIMGLRDMFFESDGINAGVTISMDIMDQSLFQLIISSGKMGQFYSEKFIWYVLYEMAKGFNYLNTNLGFFHGDIKPENILMNINGAVRITDFGLMTDIKHRVLGCGGTLNYMAPECADMKKSYGVESDSWSLGISLIEFIDLNRYFPAFFFRVPEDDRRQLIAATEYPPNCKQEMSSKMHDILRRLLKIDPNQRISMANLVKTIEGYVENKEIEICSKQDFSNKSQ